jgi:hypothetical protein
MARADADGQSSPPNPRPPREKIVVSEEDRERIERHLERMPLERDALLLAMRHSGRTLNSPHGRERTRPSQPRSTTESCRSRATCAPWWTTQ